MDKGDAVAMGGEAEVEEFYFPYITTDFSSIMDGYEYMNYELEGEVGYYQVVRLVDVSEKTYRFNIQAGGGMHAEIRYHILGDLLAQGSYGEGDTRSFETKELEVRGRMHVTHDISLDAVFYQENRTLKEVTLQSRMSYRGRFAGVNLAFYERDGRDISISYHDTDVSLDGFRSIYLFFDLHETLDPFYFDGVLGTEVIRDTSASMWGIYEGELYFRGLPSEVEEEVLDSYNVTRFPVRWEDLDTDLKGAHPGIIDRTTVNIRSRFNHSSFENLTLDDRVSYDVRVADFRLGIEDTEEIDDIYGRWWYSSEHGFIVAMDIGSECLWDELGYVTGREHISMEPMDEAEALHRMREFQDIPPMSPIEVLIRPPWAYVIMVAVIGIALVVYFYRYNKNKDEWAGT